MADEIARLQSVVAALRQRVKDLEGREPTRGALDAMRALDSMFEGIQIVGSDWTYLYVNETAARHGQRAPEELIGRKMPEIYPGIDQTEMFGTLQECMKQREPKSMLNEFEYPEGGRGWFDLRFTPVPSGVLILSVDITALKNVEQGLRESQDNLETTLSCMADAVIATDAEGLIVRMNPAAEDLTGWTLVETRGRPLSEVIHFLRAGSTDPVESTVEGILRHRMRVGLANQTELVTRDGSTIPIASSGAPMVDAQGTTRGVVLVLKDMRSEQRLVHQLQQSQKMEAVGRLAGGVAHDFNNLLTAIFSFTGFAMEDMRPEDPAFLDLQEVQKAAKRAENLTRQLLAFSRKQMATPKPTAINEHVKGMERMLVRLLGEDISFSTSFNDELWITKVDPGHLEQVVVNLAINARDAMAQGGRLTIETDNVSLDEAYAVRHGAEIPAGDYVLLAITDSGDGMDRDTQDKIFEPFFTTKAEGKGTGLGLSTCYGIVKQADGYIWVYSELGKGTTFKVYLPRFEGRAEQRKEKAPTTSLQGNETVLVVEDDDQVRALLVRTLTRNGYRVLEAANGGEGLMLAEDHREPIHLLVTDVVMPRMSGRQLAERVTRIRPETRVLFISGYTENAIVHHGVLEEGIDLLQKPFTPEIILGRVRRALKFGGPQVAKMRHRILCVDDDPRVLASIQRALRREYEIAIANGGQAAMELIESRDFDLVLCDIIMPGISGLDLYDLAKQRWPEMAERFVFIAGTVDSDFVKSFVERSQRLVLPKPFDTKHVRSLLDRVGSDG